MSHSLDLVVVGRLCVVTARDQNASKSWRWSVRLVK